MSVYNILPNIYPNLNAAYYGPIIDGNGGMQFDNFGIIEGYTIGRENTYFAKEPCFKSR